MIPARPPRVLFDASLARNPAGTGTYVRGLLSALERRPDVELHVSMFDGAGAATLDVRRKTPLSRAANSLRHLSYYWLTLPRRARAEKCDLVFCPTSLVPLAGSTPCIATIYDLTPIRFSSTQDWLSRQYLRAMLRVAIRRAVRICTISASVGRELAERFPRLTQARLAVTYPGPNPDLLLAAPEPVPMPERPFVLMVGTLEPRKNHVTALQALAEHRRRHPVSSLMLVAAGSAGWRYGAVGQTIEALGLQEHVQRVDGITPSMLNWLYRNAVALLFPSLYEGFGLPVLEAMCLRCPVVASDIPPVAEILGSSAGLLPPTRVPAWASALDEAASGRLRNPEALAHCFERAQRFSWDACAAAAVATIRAALGERP